MSDSQKDYSWATHLDYMEGAGLDVVSWPAPFPAAAKAETRPEQPVWGVLVALGLTVLAVWVSKLGFWPFTIRAAGGRVQHPMEPVMLAMLLGIALSNLWTLPARLHAGIKFSVKKLLPFGLVLLGARLEFGDLLHLGATGLLLSLVETAVAMTVLTVLARLLKLRPGLGTLLGVGTAICGGTAILAAAPTIEAEEQDVVFSVASVALLGLVAMLVMPMLGHVLELSSRQFGMWAGLIIHQTPQVVAAGYAYSPEGAKYSPLAGEIATVVKMARICLLAPMVFLLGLWHARRKARQNGPGGAKNINYLRLFPMFILGFIGVALLHSIGLIPEVTLRHADWLGAGSHTLDLAEAANQVSLFCITISMAGVGLETRMAAMRKTGFKPFLASLVGAAVVAVVMLWLIRAVGVK